jgi:hypothetical protein
MELRKYMKKIVSTGIITATMKTSTRIRTAGFEDERAAITPIIMIMIRGNATPTVM